jgi:hypothetical protein
VSSKTLSIAILSAFTALVGLQPVSAATTGAVFAGGCPESVAGPCVPGGNATETNVALLLGVAEADVTAITSGFSVGAGDIGALSGTWAITDTSITHIAFKSNGYYILGALTATSGLWDNDTTAIGGWDISIVDCPAAICMPGRDYVTADFLTHGGTIAALSNVRAFSVVPIPAALWMFGSALGFLGFALRKKAA